MSFVARACKTAEEWEASIQRLRAPANGSHALAPEGQRKAMAALRALSNAYPYHLDRLPVRHSRDG